VAVHDGGDLAGSAQTAGEALTELGTDVGNKLVRVAHSHSWGERDTKRAARLTERCLDVDAEREETGNSLLRRVDNGQRRALPSPRSPSDYRIPPLESSRRGRPAPSSCLFLVWRLMDGSHILLIVVGILAALSAVTSLGAMFSLGRGKAYDK
jgi:hypothetical protein